MKSQKVDILDFLFNIRQLNDEQINSLQEETKEAKHDGNFISRD